MMNGNWSIFNSRFYVSFEPRAFTEQEVNEYLQVVTSVSFVVRVRRRKKRRLTILMRLILEMMMMRMRMKREKERREMRLVS